ncbi:unnamed protein product [Gulo gulo]|uniref:Uncharacterized protein n=1 Tax=Gulo gulo TaxID=48420 RepID=A0A9X9PY07_GULGU|nr:unnamed protein product [Gulo gulo]
MSVFRESCRYTGCNVTYLSGLEVRLLLNPKPPGLFSSLVDHEVKLM